MTELKSLDSTQLDALSRPLPDEAVSPHPTKKYLSSIKSIYVTERLNEVFGVGKWRIETEIIERADKMVVVKLNFLFPTTAFITSVTAGMTIPTWEMPTKAPRRMRSRRSHHGWVLVPMCSKESTRGAECRRKRTAIRNHRPLLR